MEEQYVPVSDYAKAVWARRWLIAVTLLAVVSATFVKLFFFTQKMYRAEATIIVKPKAGGASMASSVLAGAALPMLGGISGGSYDIPSLVKSRALAEELLKNNPSVAERYNTMYKVKFERKDLVKRLMDSVAIDTAKPMTTTLYYIDKDPAFAAEMDNLYIDTLLSTLALYTRDDAAAKTQYLRDQIARKEVELQDIETKLRSFEESEKTVAIADEIQLKMNAYYQIKLQYEKDTIERDATEKKLQVSGSEKPGAAGMGDKAYFSDPTLQSLKNKLSDAQIELLKNREILKPDNVILKQNKAKIDTITNEIRQYTNTLQSDVRNTILFDLAVLDAKLAAEAELMKTYEGMFVGAPQKKLIYERLVRDKKIMEQVYVYLKQEYEKSELDTRDSDTPVRVLDRAVAPEKKYSPKIMMSLVVAGMAGLFLGLLLAFTADVLKRVKTEAKA